MVVHISAPLQARTTLTTGEWVTELRCTKHNNADEITRGRSWMRRKAKVVYDVVEKTLTHRGSRIP